MIVGLLSRICHGDRQRLRGLPLSTHGWTRPRRISTSRSGTRAGAGRNLCDVTSQAQLAPGPASHDAGAVPAAYRWMRPLAVGAVNQRVLLHRGRAKVRAALESHYSGRTV